MERMFARLIERTLSVRFLRRYGLAILVCCVLPGMFWLAGIAALSLGAAGKTFGEITRDCWWLVKVALALVLPVYACIWALEWRDRRRSKDKNL